MLVVFGVAKMSFDEWYVNYRRETVNATTSMRDIAKAAWEASPSLIVLPSLPNSLDNTDVAKAYRAALEDLKKLNPHVEWDE